MLNKILRRINSWWIDIIDNIRVVYLNFFLRTMGANVRIKKDCIISCPNNLTIGDNIYIGNNCMLHAEGGITIGSDTMIGPYTTVWTSNHIFRDKKIPIRLQGSRNEAVVIEDDVWIGANVVILPGVTVGKGSVIGAGAVVTKNIKPYIVVGGNPARMIRAR